MDILLLLTEKKNTLGYKGKGDYKKTSYSKISKLSSSNSKLSKKYVFTGWQIINKNFITGYSEKKFSLKKVYDLAENKNRLYGIVFPDFFFHVSDPKAYYLINNFLKLRDFSRL